RWPTAWPTWSVPAKALWRATVARSSRCCCATATPRRRWNARSAWWPGSAPAPCRTAPPAWAMRSPSASVRPACARPTAPAPTTCCAAPTRPFTGPRPTAATAPCPPARRRRSCCRSERQPRPGGRPAPGARTLPPRSDESADGQAELFLREAPARAGEKEEAGREGREEARRARSQERHADGGMNDNGPRPACIWVDADACPVPVREMLFRAAMRARVQLTLVANQWLRTPPSPFIRAIQVQGGYDVADDAIAERAGAGDLVVTQDIPLAARVLANGALAVNPRGERFTADNIAERLSVRNFMEEL